MAMGGHHHLQQLSVSLILSDSEQRGERERIQFWKIEICTVLPYKDARAG